MEAEMQPGDLLGSGTIAGGCGFGFDTLASKTAMAARDGWSGGD